MLVRDLPGGLASVPNPVRAGSEVDMHILSGHPSPLS